MGERKRRLVVNPDPLRLVSAERRDALARVFGDGSRLVERPDLAVCQRCWWPGGVRPERISLHVDGCPVAPVDGARSDHHVWQVQVLPWGRAWEVFEGLTDEFPAASARLLCQRCPN